MIIDRPSPPEPTIMDSTRATTVAAAHVPALFGSRQPLSWIRSVADQVAGESGLAVTADIEDLVIVSYVGLLDSPDPYALSRERLLCRSRRALICWAWEQGAHDEAIPTLKSQSAPGAPAESR